jgi:hypothetical protein
MSRDDLHADLMADLAPKAEPALPVAPEPAPLPPEPHDATPAISLQWTPLRWSRPKVVRSSDGAGKALKLGPLKVELTVTE